MSPPTALPTIALVDDDPGVRKALSRVLRVEDWSVETFDSAEAFLADLGERPWACLVLDVSMPGLDGLELQRRLAERRRSLPIVFVSGHGSIPISVQAETLVAAIREAIARQLTARRRDTDSTDLQQRLNRLTPREYEVLVAVAAGRRNKEIAADLGVVEQTIKFHRARIMERMQAGNAAELMHIAARLRIAGTNAAADVPAELNARASKRPGERATAPLAKPKTAS